MGTGQSIPVFVERFGRRPELQAKAPGRVNILGEHTDYNEGFVFPVAIDRHLSVLAAPRSDSLVRAYSIDFRQEAAFRLDDVRRSEEAPWSNYLRGVLSQYLERGDRIAGMDVVVSGNVPVGAGLSSSAAFEVAVAEAVRVLNGIQIDKVEMALLCQAAEASFVGVHCGIMDQFVSVLAQEDSALFLDCRDLSYSMVPLPDGIRVVACDSRVQRRLDASAYNQRRAECAAAVDGLKPVLGAITALRDVTPDTLRRNRERLPEVVYRRARHVVAENERVLRGIELLRNGDSEGFGSLLYESHESLRSDYEVSCPELDTLVESARRAPGTLGARMTGAGFGGCTVNLVRSHSVPAFVEFVRREFRSKTGGECEVHVCRPSAGVGFERIAREE